MCLARDLLSFPSFLSPRTDLKWNCLKLQIIFFRGFVSLKNRHFPSLENYDNTRYLLNWAFFPSLPISLRICKIYRPCPVNKPPLSALKLKKKNSLKFYCQCKMKTIISRQRRKFRPLNYICRPICRCVCIWTHCWTCFSAAMLQKIRLKTGKPLTRFY